MLAIRLTSRLKSLGAVHMVSPLRLQQENFDRILDRIDENYCYFYFCLA